MERCSVHIGQLQLHLARCVAIDISFCKVLLARTGSLHHLVYGAIAGLQILMSEIVGNVVDTFRLTESLQRTVVVALPKKVFVLLHSFFSCLLTA